MAILLTAASVVAQPLPHDLMPPPSTPSGFEFVGVAGDDDRRLSAFPFVANIGAGAKSLGTGVAIGRRHLITAAHLFVRQGKWTVTGLDRRPVGPEYEPYRVFIEGCPSHVYGVSNVFVSTLDPDTHRKLDYAVVQLDQPHCGSSATLWSMTDNDVDRILFGNGADQEPRLVTAAGYYGPYSIDLFDQSAALETGVFENLRHDMTLAWQYAAEGTGDRRRPRFSVQ